MAEDPHAHEVGRLEDEQGRVLIVGVDHDTVTLRAVHPAGEAVELSASQTEELAQLLVSATWQAAAYLGGAQGRLEAEVAAGGAP